MHFVILATHTAEVCPTGNQKIREMLKETGPQIPEMAERNGVTLVAGPYVNQEHITLLVLEADKPEAVDRFIIESRLAQWSTVHIVPSKPLLEALSGFDDQPVLF